MPQNGFHGLFGLATAAMVVTRAPVAAAQPLTAGIVLGAMLPDVDMYPTGVAFLLKHAELTYVIHRTATHSLFFALMILLVGLSVPRWRWACFGLSIGVCTHLALDTFFWFTQVALFWPFSRMDMGLPIFNLWSEEKLSGLWVNVREAFEFAAFALLLGSLRGIASHFGNAGASLVKWERALWVCFALAMGTAFSFRDASTNQHYVVTTPYLLLFLPYCWYQVWRLRSEIARWAQGRREAPSTSLRDRASGRTEQPEFGR